MSRGNRRRAVGAHYALPVGFTAMLAVGATAAALHSAFTATGVLVTVAVMVTALSAAAEPPAVPLLGLVGWLTAIGFSRPPYAQLRPAGPLAERAAITIGAFSPVAA